jgi:hypothetical protein
MAGTASCRPREGSEWQGIDIEKINLEMMRCEMIKTLNTKLKILNKSKIQNSKDYIVLTSVV